MKMFRLYLVILWQKLSFSWKMYINHQMVYIDTYFQICLRLQYFYCFSTKINNIYKHKIKIYAEIGSPRRELFFNSKYWVIQPLLVTHDYCPFKKNPNPINKICLNPNFSKGATTRSWSNRSNAFSMSIVTR